MSNKTGLFSNLKGDILGGITAGIVALPLALAFGVSSGLGAAAGLYGAIGIGFFAALFGGTNTQISGPTAPMTAVSMVVIAGIIGANDGNVEKALPYILTVFILAGLFQVLLGILGFGKYIKYIPYPVVSGFMTAIGVMILITQILPFLGYYPQDDAQFVEQFKPEAEEILLEKILQEEAAEGILVLEDYKETIERAEKITDHVINIEAKNLAKSISKTTIGTLKIVPRALQNINWIEFGLALATIFIIYGFKRITTTIPSTLVALFIVSGAAIAFNLNYRPIEQIPTGLPIPHFEIFTNFDLPKITPYIFTAISLALLGAIDSLLTSVVADNMTKTQHNPNKELIGQGIGNSIAGLIGGIPGAGATIRTVVNINAGGKTRLSGMIAAVLLLVILLALGPIASKIPAAVLAGILVTVGIGVMDYKGLKAIPNMPKTEVIIMIIVLILSVFWDLVFAVGLGLVIASLVFMKKMGDITSNQSKVSSIAEEIAWQDEKELSPKLREEVFVKHLNGPLFFGFTSEFQQLARQVPDTASTVVIRMDNVPYMDQSGLYAFEDIILDLVKKDIQILLVGLKEQPHYLMSNIDIIPDLIPEAHIFENFHDCNEWIGNHVIDLY
ncbi:bicarbonate transporter BicA [Flavobacteriaceae bacterium UJ101]|nr:bicarbonate transporter BicA [Flavobacteriaceae bacterium UJ101]